MKTTTFELSGKPYFILEQESGVFYAVSRLELIGKKTNVNAYQSLENLELGLDLIEVPTRGISLVLRIATEKEIHALPYVIEELKKLASISFMDYFSYESFGNDCCKSIACNQNEEIYEVKPRLFRKLVND